MTERDPRTDPRPGDVLEKPRKPPFDGYTKRRSVERINPDGVIVFSETRIDEFPIVTGASLGNFQAWAKAATVIKRGEES